LLLVPFSLPIARSASALDPGPQETSLDVRQPGGQSQWGNFRTIHALNAVTFRWKTDIQGVSNGEWQLFDYKPQSNGMNETPFARQCIGSPSAQFQHFAMDFAQLRQQYPGKIPANAPATPRDYYVRVVPWTLDCNTSAVAGPISDVVKITYVKSPPAPPEPPTIKYLFTWLHGHYITLDYFASKPVIPVVTVSTSAPGKDSKGNPEFDKNQIVSSAFPILSGYDADGGVQLVNLQPRTHYHFIIMVKDEKGGVAYKTGEFTTEKPFANVIFDKIYMIDDSEGPTAGAGDMTFGFFVNGRNVLGPKKSVPTNTKYEEFSTGETHTYSILFTLENPPDKFEIRVNGADQDDQPQPIGFPLALPPCTFNVVSPNMKNGHGAGCENAVATMTADLNSFPIGVDEEVPKSFTMTAVGGDHGNLKFKVFGRFGIHFGGGIPYVNK
jgi:hypothetical protein